jgi:ribonuclease HI
MEVVILNTVGVKTIIQGKEENTTHNRMELLAVINAIKQVTKTNPTINKMEIITDSQYVVGLTARQKKLTALNFKTKKDKAIANSDLVIELLNLVNSLTIQFIKIKAHLPSKNGVNYNNEVDKLSRKIVREAVKEIKII